MIHVGHTLGEHISCFFSLPLGMRKRKRSSRLYDPITARMMNADPFIADFSSAQDFNRYSYVRNNPLRYTDPSGYWPRWLRLGWRKNVPMFTSSDYSAAAPSQLGIDDYESPSNNADDGSGWLWIYRDELRGATGAISGIPGATLRFLNGNRTTFREKKEFYIQSHKADLIHDFGEDVFYANATRIRTRPNWMMPKGPGHVEASNKESGYYYEPDIYGNQYPGYVSIITISRKTIKDYWKNQDNESSDPLFHDFLHAKDIFTGFKNYLNQTNRSSAEIIFEYRAYLYVYMKFGTGFDELVIFFFEMSRLRFP